ncbi:MAG: TAXI family TRAP transporter solute-binding subunit [Deltaproteobacteria bacterium]|nr:TAXI family TRAP transporter solute-binding subunit [Deltaproteobacteria bacterium]
MNKTALAGLTFVLTTTLLCAPAHSESRRISIGTADVGGTYYPMGGSMANLISKKLPGFEATALVTAGAVENIRLLDKKEVDIGFTLSFLSHKAMEGEKPFSKKIDHRAIMTLYPNIVMLVTLADSNIKSWKDLKGKRVSVGAAGSGLENAFKDILDAEGLTYKDFTPVYLGTSEASDAVLDKRVDASAMGGSFFSPSLKSMSMSKKVYVVPVSKEGHQRLSARTRNSYSGIIIPANAAPGFPEDSLQIETPVQLAVRADEDESFVYNLLKLTFENMAELRQSHKVWEYVDVKRGAVRGPLPFHPAAVKFYKEKGVWKD